jgi:hypothetical protein
MNTMILRVKKCGAMTTVQGENGEVNKRMLVLQELGDKWADAYVVTVFRNLATIEFAEGDLVAASMQFRTHDYNGQTYMDIVANEIVKLK